MMSVAGRLCCLRRRLATSRFLGSRVRMSLRGGCPFLVFVVYCVGSGLCEELITRSSNNCVRLTVCDLEALTRGDLNPSPVVAPHKKNELVLISAAYQDA